MFSMTSIIPIRWNFKCWIWETRFYTSDCIIICCRIICKCQVTFTRNITIITIMPSSKFKCFIMLWRNCNMIIFVWFWFTIINICKWWTSIKSKIFKDLFALTCRGQIDCCERCAIIEWIFLKVHITAWYIKCLKWSTFREGIFLNISPAISKEYRSKFWTPSKSRIRNCASWHWYWCKIITLIETVWTNRFYSISILNCRNSAICKSISSNFFNT